MGNIIQSTRISCKVAIEFLAVWVLAPPCWKDLYSYSSSLTSKKILEFAHFDFLNLLYLRIDGSSYICCTDSTAYANLTSYDILYISVVPS